MIVVRENRPGRELLRTGCHTFRFDVITASTYGKTTHIG